MMRLPRGAISRLDPGPYQLANHGYGLGILHANLGRFGRHLVRIGPR